MAQRLILLKDANGNVFYGTQFSPNAYNTTLVVGTAQTIPIPGDCDVAFFSWTSGADIFVNPIGTAVVPGGAVASTTSYMNPICRQVTPGGNLSIITPATNAYVEVSFFRMSSLGLQ